jgi:fibro-slime domain-containing protein
MRKQSLMLTVVGLGMALTLTLATSPALALSLTGNYFTLSATHPDTLGGIDGTTVTGLVAPALVGGLPVYTGVLPPSSGAITDLGAGNTIQWWTAHTTVVTTDIVRSDAFTGGVLGGGAFASSFFPNGHVNDASGYRSVHWTGAFHVGAGGATLHLSADDDAWLFLNGNRVLDNGGVKAIGLATTSTATLVAGDYNVDLFFADRHQTQSGIVFDCEGCLDPVPEPATLLLFGTTLAGLGAVVRRRIKGNKEVA